MSDSDPSLRLSQKEIDRCFAESKWAELYPPILTIEQAAAMLQVSKHTIRDWRSRGLLDACGRRVGKRVRFMRDRLVEWYFNGRAGRVA